jgi:hypothetical protein
LPLLSEPAVTDRQGIGFGWLQNAWLLHARLKIHRGGIDAPSMASTENPRAGSLRRGPAELMLIAPDCDSLSATAMAQQMRRQPPVPTSHAEVAERLSHSEAVS